MVNKMQIYISQMLGMWELGNIHGCSLVIFQAQTLEKYFLSSRWGSNSQPFNDW